MIDKCPERIRLRREAGNGPEPLRGDCQQAGEAVRIRGASPSMTGEAALKSVSKAQVQAVEVSSREGPKTSSCGPLSVMALATRHPGPGKPLSTAKEFCASK